MFKATIYFRGESLFIVNKPYRIDNVTLEQTFDFIEQVWVYAQNFNVLYAALGLRSLMVGDIIEFNKVFYQLEGFGYSIVEKPRPLCEQENGEQRPC